MSTAPLVYVDTSALGALLVAQPETQELVNWLDREDACLVSSDLLETELRRMAVREGRDQSKVSALLEGVSLAALDRATYRSAGFLPMQYLRTLDALHLEAAIRLDADAVLTYDRRLGEAAETAGLDVISPWRGRVIRVNELVDRARSFVAANYPQADAAFRSEEGRYMMHRTDCHS